MKIQKTDNISFSNLTKTSKLFETMLLKNFESEGINGMKTVIKDLYPNLGFVGNRGYKYYAIELRDNILKKYPEIANDVSSIQKHINENPEISKKELALYVKPFIDKYGENIDIVL